MTIKRQSPLYLDFDQVQLNDGEACFVFAASAKPPQSNHVFRDAFGTNQTQRGRAR